MKRLVTAALLLATGQLALADDLAGLYQRAVDNDPQIRAARATRLAAGEAKPIAESGLKPSVSATGNIDYNHRDYKGAGEENFESHSAGLQVVQPLYRRDRLYRVDQADAQIAQAEANLRLAEQALLLRVAQAYFGVLAAQETLTFSKAEEEAIARQLDQAKRRFEVGLIAITGVHEAQARYDAARANVITAQTQVDNALEVLLEIVGGPVDDLERLARDVPMHMPVPSDLDQWTAVALDNSPAVKAAREQVEVARYEVEVQRSGRYPSVDLVGGYTISRSDSNQSVDANGASIGVQLAVPLYTGGGVPALTRQAAYNLEAAREVLEQQRRLTARQVRDAYRGIEASISRVEALDASTVSANSALEATQAGFEVGTRTLVDVLNAQSELFRARRDFAQARYDYVVNLLALEQAAGTLSAEDLNQVNGWLK